MARERNDVWNSVSSSIYFIFGHVVDRKNNLANNAGDNSALATLLWTWIVAASSLWVIELLLPSSTRVAAQPINTWWSATKTFTARPAIPSLELETSRREVWHRIAAEAVRKGINSWLSGAVRFSVKYADWQTLSSTRSVKYAVKRANLRGRLSGTLWLLGTLTFRDADCEYQWLSRTWERAAGDIYTTVVVGTTYFNDVMWGKHPYILSFPQRRLCFATVYPRASLPYPSVYHQIWAGNDGVSLGSHRQSSHVHGERLI